ncbi:MAG: hypothetical protein PUE51_05920 [Veillonellaceae bacterium]|jgi:hypothetical protein|nr:hypothetical protein [Veillonellaceae bacterium]
MAKDDDLEINEEMEEADIITKLLAADPEHVPTMVVPLKRLGIPVTVKALTGKQVARTRERNTQSIKTKKGPVDKLDYENFNIGLIVQASVKPNWNDAKLLEKFRASSGTEVVKRLLLAGEISLLGEAVLDVSGFNIDLDDLKN